MSCVHRQAPARCPALTAAPRISPLDLPYLLAKPGEVLRELHHDDDEGPPQEHAGGPQQRVEDDAVVVQAGQQHRLLLLAGVVVTRDMLVRLQTLGDVHDHDMHGEAVLLAPGHVETLQRDKMKGKGGYLEGSHVVRLFVLLMGWGLL